MIAATQNYLANAWQQSVAAWDRFWFTPQPPQTLAVIRICTGLMLFYTHAVWTCDWEGFFGSAGWLDAQARELIYSNLSPFEKNCVWSHFFWISDPTTLWVLHWVGLVIFACMTLGFCTRTMSVLAWLWTVSYARRVPIALFGLDAINLMLAMYLMLGPSGAVWSVDAWLKKRRVANTTGQGSVATNISLRLIQLHMCLIYLFSALGKLKGDMWWAGDALWGAVGNLEYQSLDLTWMASWPLLIGLLTHVTVLWELGYPALIWNKSWRPVMLALAVFVHLGIGLGMGMMTFGLVMIIGNLAFVEASFWPLGWSRAAVKEGTKTQMHTDKKRR